MELHGRRGRRGALSTAFGVVLVALTALGAVSAQAAPSSDGVPRPPGAIDNRGWELVSPVIANGALLTAASLGNHVDDRAALAYIGAGPGSPVGGSTQLVATRTASGWTSQSMVRPSDQVALPLYTLLAATPDFSSSIMLATSGYIGANPPLWLLFKSLANTPQTLLQTFGEASSGFIGFVASADLSRVFNETDQVTFGFGETLGKSYVYEYGSGTPALVSRMPDGSVPVCGVPPIGLQGFGNTGVTRTYTHTISTDGSLAFFHSSGDNCSAPPELYMRDVVNNTTTLISGPPLAGTAHGAQFLQATADGSQIFFLTSTRLSPDDTNALNDVYRYTIGQGNECLTCGGPVAAGVQAPDGSGNGEPQVSEDGSRVYFHSAAALAPGGTGDLNDIYVWHDGTVRFVASSSGLVVKATDLTPDGSVILFRANNPSLDVQSGSNGGGQDQYYRYDDRDQSLTCVSCPPSGAPAPGGVWPTLVDRDSGRVMGIEGRHAMSDDGSVLAFLSFSPLVPQDVNGDWDIYEWHNGEIGLITDGVSTYAPIPDTVIRLLDVSADGKDILFANDVKLTGDPIPDHPAPQVYTARVNGGFAPKIAVPCLADACQGPTPTPPTLDEPSSAALLGAGNVIPPARISLAGKRVSGKSVVLQVHASAAGRISVSGERVRSIHRRVSKAGTYRLRVVLTRHARGLLADREALAVRIRVGYTSADGDVSRVSVRAQVKG